MQKASKMLRHAVLKFSYRGVSAENPEHVVSRGLLLRPAQLSANLQYAIQDFSPCISEGPAQPGTLAGHRQALPRPHCQGAHICEASNGTATSTLCSL